MEVSAELLDLANIQSEADLRREWAIWLYRDGRVSQAKAAELAGMDRWTFQQLLGQRHIPINYDLEELKRDLDNLGLTLPRAS